LRAQNKIKLPKSAFHGHMTITSRSLSSQGLSQVVKHKKMDMSLIRNQQVAGSNPIAGSSFSNNPVLPGKHRGSKREYFNIR